MTSDNPEARNIAISQASTFAGLVFETYSSRRFIDVPVKTNVVDLMNSVIASELSTESK